MSFSLRCILVIAVCVAFAFNAYTANAEGFYISGDLGIADPGNEFDEATSYRIAGGYLFFDRIGFEISRVELDDIDIKTFRDSHVEITGFSAHAYWRHKFNHVLGMDLGLGVFDSESKAVLLGQSAGKSSDTSAYTDIRLITEFNDLLSAFAAARYISDVSGADISNLSFGLTVSF